MIRPNRGGITRRRSPSERRHDGGIAFSPGRHPAARRASYSVPPGGALHRGSSISNWRHRTTLPSLMSARATITRGGLNRRPRFRSIVDGCTFHFFRCGATPVLGRGIVGRKVAATIGLIAALLVSAPSSQAAVITQMLGTANYNQWRDRRDWHLRVEPERRPCAVRQADRRQDQRPQPLDQFYLFRLWRPDRQPDLFGNARVRPL